MEEVFDPLRKKRVALTPEENVRQQFIRYLNEKRQWPLYMMMSEAEISLGDVRFRCDIVCYENRPTSCQKDFITPENGEFEQTGPDATKIGKTEQILMPRMIVECKRPSVKITSKTFEQIWHYALILKVEYLVVTNGGQTFVCRYDSMNKKYVFINDIPSYEFTARGDTKNGDTKDGATKDGATKDGATKDGATKDGATKDGATKDGATKDRPITGF